MAALGKLSRKALAFYNERRASVRTVSQAIRDTYSRFPDEHEYQPPSFYNYNSSDEGEKALEKALKKVRDQAESRTFGARQSRVFALIEIAEEMFQILQAYADEGETDKLFKHAPEFRQVLKSIKDEMEEVSSGVSQDALSEFLAKMKGKDRPSWMQEAFGESLEDLEISSDEN